MRLIDATLIIRALQDEEEYGADMEYPILLLQNAPTIEAKPVVYCKDCKYNVANSKHDPLDITDYTDITCEYFMTDGMSPNDFCSQGRRVNE